MRNSGNVGPTAELVARPHELRTLGSSTGVVEHSCPLCAADHDAASFAAGLDRMAGTIDRLNQQASETAAEAERRRAAINAADRKIVEAQRARTALATRADEQRAALEKRRLTLGGLGLCQDAPRSAVLDFRDVVAGELETARHSLRILGTRAQNRLLETGTAKPRAA